MAAARGVSAEQVEKQYVDAEGYAAFKADVADAVVDLFDPVRQRYAILREDESNLERVLRRGADKARPIAAETVRTVRTRMGVGAPA
jgi:tryptophanyl-tRNA synthetase